MQSRLFNRCLLAGTLGLGLTLFLQPVLAQIPTQVNPGLVAPVSPQEGAPSGQTPEEEKRFLPKVDETEVQLDKPKVQKPIVDLQSKGVQINHINVVGVTLLPPQEIQRLAAPYESRFVTLQELNKFVESVNDAYAKKGFYSSFAFIAPQSIQNGEVTVKVSEGSVGDVTVEGNKYYKAHIVKSQLGLDPGEFLNLKTLESDLNRVNRTNGYFVKAVLSPGESSGKTDVTLKVMERNPWQVAPTFDNQGRPFIGTLRYGAEVSNQSLLGYGDQLYARYLGASNTQIAMAGYQFPIIPKWGTELGLNYSFSHVNVDLDLGPQPDIDGFAHNYGVLLTQPLNRSRSLVADAGINFRHIMTKINDEKINADDIVNLQFGVNFDKFDRWGRTLARLQTTVAPLWMGSNQQFWKSEGNLTRIFRLPKSNLLILRGYAQLTPDALPSAEQMQIGGAFSVRGYTEGLLIGDRGYSFGVEHRWPILGLRYLSPWLADRVQGATFFDMGQVWLDHSNDNFVAGVSNDSDRSLLVGAGIGVRARLTRFLEGFVDFGFGLVNRTHVEPNADPTCRVHFGVRSNLVSEAYRDTASRQKPGPSQVPSVPPPVVPSK